MKSALLSLGPEFSAWKEDSIYLRGATHTPAQHPQQAPLFLSPSTGPPYAYHCQQPPNQDKLVNLRETFEEESSYRPIQVLSCKKKNKRAERHSEGIAGRQEPGCCHGKKAEV